MSDKNKGAIDFSKFIAQLTTVFKAVPNDKLADLKDSIDHVGAAEISDMWNEAGGEHTVPSRAQIVTGPAEPMSGRGAEKMIRECHVDLSAQGGLSAVYATFHSMLSEFGKAMQGGFDKKFAALAGVVSDVAKSHAAIESALKSAVEVEPVAKAEVNLEDTFLGKALEKFAKARVAFRKAEMCDEDDEKEERKSKIAEASSLLKSALKLVAKADEDEKHDDEEMEKALSSVKALASKVSAALAVITKAEDDEKKDEEEKAEKARVAAEAAAKAAEPTVKAEDTEEEKKDDTAKSLAALKAHMAQLEGAVTGNGEVLQTTLKGFMDTISGMSRTLVTPPNMAVIKAGTDLSAKWETAVSAGQITGADLIAGQSILNHMRAPGFPQDRLNQELSAASPALRQIFVG